MVLKVHTEDSSGVYYTIRASGIMALLLTTLLEHFMNCPNGAGSQPGSPGAEIQTIESYLQVRTNSMAFVYFPRNLNICFRI